LREIDTPLEIDTALEERGSSGTGLVFSPKERVRTQIKQTMDSREEAKLVVTLISMLKISSNYKTLTLIRTSLMKMKSDAIVKML
jgi:hypothetical protein